ncbi:hypothetical protein [Kitasatospora sp. NPDC056184]
MQSAGREQAFVLAIAAARRRLRPKVMILARAAGSAGAFRAPAGPAV